MNKELRIIGFFIGVPSIAWLISLTDWKVTLAIFLCMWANNLSQSKD